MVLSPLDGGTSKKLRVSITQDYSRAEIGAYGIGDTRELYVSDEGRGRPTEQQASCSAPTEQWKEEAKSEGIWKRCGRSRDRRVGGRAD